MEIFKGRREPSRKLDSAVPQRERRVLKDTRRGFNPKGVKFEEGAVNGNPRSGYPGS